MNEMNIVYVYDDNYFNPTLVSMTSVLKNCTGKHNVKFHLFSTNYNEKDEKIISEMLSNYNCDYKIYNMKKYEHYFSTIDDNIKIDNHVNKTTFFRFLIFKILNDVDKCLYLDSDIIVDSDIGDVYDNIESKYLLGAVVDIWAMQNRDTVLKHLNKWAEFKKFINEPIKNPYFNAGFLLINVKKSIELNMWDECLECLLAHQNTPLGDQDVLNATFGQNHNENMMILPAKYNVNSTLNRKTIYDNAYYSVEEINNSFDNPSVIHFVSANKPWLLRNSHYYKEWFEYAYYSPISKVVFDKCVESSTKIDDANYSIPISIKLLFNAIRSKVKK